MILLFLTFMVASLTFSPPTLAEEEAEETTSYPECGGTTATPPEDCLCIPENDMQNIGWSAASVSNSGIRVPSATTSKCICSAAAKPEGCRVGLQSKRGRDKEGETTRETNIEKAIKEAKEICKEVYENAAMCCHYPEKCRANMLQVPFTFTAVFKNMAGGGINDRCQMLKDGMLANTAHAKAVKTECYLKINKCKKTCGEAIKKVKTRLNQACSLFEEESNQDSGESSEESEEPEDSEDTDLSKIEYKPEFTCTKDFFEKYVEKEFKKDKCASDLNPDPLFNDKKIPLSGIVKECKNVSNLFDEALNGFMEKAIQSMALSQACQKFAGGRGVYRPPPPGGLTRPNIPFNLGGEEWGSSIGGGDTTEEDTKKPGGSNSSNTNEHPIAPPDLVVDGDDEDKFPGALPGSGGLVSGSSSGGASGGSAGGGSGAGSGYGDQGKKQKAATAKGGAGKVLAGGYKGSKGFGGYGYNSSRGGGGKWDQRRAKGAKEKGRKMASLDLKKLFGKSKKNINPVVGKLGSPHENIFERISNRYRYMCQTKRLSCKGYTGL